MKPISKLITMKKEIRELVKKFTQVEVNRHKLSKELRSLADNFDAYNSNGTSFVKSMNEFIEEMKYNKGYMADSIKTGYHEIDTRFGAFNQGDLIVVAGRPSMGKTQLMINMSLNMSKKDNVLYVTSDLSARLLSRRFLATTAESSNIEKMKKDSTKKEEYNFSNLIISENKELKEIITLCRNQFKLNNIKVVFIDYLQLLNNVYLLKNPEKKLCTMLNKLKQLAVELNICIVVSSQLNKKAEARGFASYPQLCDLRDMGASEKLASKVLILYRPEYYGFELDDENKDTKGILKVSFVKNKNGPEGKICLRRIENFNIIDNI